MHTLGQTTMSNPLLRTPFGQVELRPVAPPPGAEGMQTYVLLPDLDDAFSREVGDFIERHSGLSSEPFEVDRFIPFESRLSRHGAHYEEVAGFGLD